jgi:hypothetical protein
MEIRKSDAEINGNSSLLLRLMEIPKYYSEINGNSKV